MYRYISIYRIGREYEKCLVHHEFGLIGVHFSRQAGFRRPKIVRPIMNSGVSESGISRHICMYADY